MFFEAKCIVSTSYSKEFRKLCAQLNDHIYQYCDMSEKEDLAKVTSSSGCIHNEYEKRRAAHCWKHLSNARDEFETASEAIKESEMAIFTSRILPQLGTVLDQLQVLISDHLESSTKSSTQDLIKINDCTLKSSKQLQDTMKELKLPPVKPRWVQLTDAGPGVGVSNFSVRFRDAELQSWSKTLGALSRNSITFTSFLTTIYILAHFMQNFMSKHPLSPLSMLCNTLDV
jgi:hypothetical protein